MAAQILAFTLEFKKAATCLECGVPVVMTSDFMEQRLRDHRNFYCLNGHSQYWPQQSDEEKLRSELRNKERELAAANERAATNFAAREKAERELHSVKRRVGGGACPCCKRSFVQLTRHMKTKHPEYRPAT